MLSCDVVCDLLIVYASGEASEATRQVVEEHLPQCPECQETLRQVQDAQGSLASLQAETVPDDGGRFLTRLRQLIFTLGAGLLFLGGYGLAMTAHILYRNFGIPILQTGIPSLAPIWRLLGMVAFVALVLLQRQSGLRLSQKGSWPGVARALSVVSLVLFTFIAYAVTSAGYLLDTLLFGLLLAGAYVLVLDRRQWQLGPVWSLLAAAALQLVLVAAAYNVVLNGDVASALIAGALVLAALVITLVRLPRLPHATWMTLLVLFLGVIFLTSRIGLSIGALVEDSLSLPQPAAGMTVSQAAQPDLEPLGFTLGTSQAVAQVDDLPLGDNAEASRSIYSRSDSRLIVTAVHFERQQAAYDTFSAWVTTLPAELWALEVPDREIGRGRVAYGYDGTGERAFAAWHSGLWAIFIEVPGPYNQAMPLSLRVKELIVNR